MNPWRTASASFATLRGARVRSSLSSAAVMIGVGAVVSMSVVRLAAETDLLARIHSMGSDVLVVRAGRFQTFGKRTQQSGWATTLTPRDAGTIRQASPLVVEAAAAAEEQTVVTLRGNRAAPSIVGAEARYFSIERLAVVAGRGFSENDLRSRARVAVLGVHIAQELFGLADPIGDVVKIGGVPFTVVGVAGRPGRLAADDDRAKVFVPLSTMLTRVLHRDHVDRILVRCSSRRTLTEARDDIVGALRAAHHLRAGRPDDFTIQDPVLLLRAESDAGVTFRAIAAALGALGLATGGIGILATMLLAVRERVGEVGLRRAVGARRTEIALQFLMEASILGAAGASVGAVLGLGVGAVAARIAGWSFVWPTSDLLLAFLLADTIGLFAGAAPAFIAARLDPAVALREK